VVGEFTVPPPGFVQRDFQALHIDFGVPKLTGAPAAEEEIVLSGGELLLFDNLAVAHGRRGRRATGELHQLCVGFRSLGLPGQVTLLDRFLAAFAASAGTPDSVAAPARP
jgi:hypothetical protein